MCHGTGLSFAEQPSIDAAAVQSGSMVIYGCMSGKAPPFRWDSWVFREVQVWTGPLLGFAKCCHAGTLPSLHAGTNWSGFAMSCSCGYCAVLACVNRNADRTVLGSEPRARLLTVGQA